MTNLSPQIRITAGTRKTDRLLRAETPEEIELLLLFRSLTEPQQKAFMKMLKATVAFQAAMRAGGEA